MHYGGIERKVDSRISQDRTGRMRNESQSETSETSEANEREYGSRQEDTPGRGGRSGGFHAVGRYFLFMRTVNVRSPEAKALGQYL